MRIKDDLSIEGWAMGNDRGGVGNGEVSGGGAGG